VFSQRGEGWVEKPLGEACIFQGGSQPPKSDFSSEQKPGYVRLIQIRDYKSDKRAVYIPKEKSKRYCFADDVMIGRYGPPLFQILRGIEGSYNVALIKVSPKDGYVTKDYLYYFLKNRDILQYIINSSNRAAGQIGLNKKTIEPYLIGFPPIVGQIEICNQLKDLEVKVSSLESIYIEKLDLLDQLKKSLLQKAFSGELTQSKGIAI
jgi:type I restriction enzyme S subunit